MATNITEFKKLVAPDILACPDLIVNREILTVILDFCTKTNILQRDFQIDLEFACIRDRMVHGIKGTVERPKYQAGLVIDLEKLSKTLPNGMIQINEIGTLLVYDDIPFECLIDCLHEDRQLQIFWRLV